MLSSHEFYSSALTQLAKEKADMLLHKKEIVFDDDELKKNFAERNFNSWQLSANICRSQIRTVYRECLVGGGQSCEILKYALERRCHILKINKNLPKRKKCV